MKYKMNRINEIKQELQKYIDKEKAEYLPIFFKAYTGDCGEGKK